MTVLVTVLLLWRSTMSKTTSKRKHPTRGLLTVSQGLVQKLRWWAQGGKWEAGKQSWCWSGGWHLAWNLQPEKDTELGIGFGSLHHHRCHTSCCGPLGTKHSNVWTYGGGLIQTTTVLRIPAIEDSLGSHREILSPNTDQMSRELKHSPIKRENDKMATVSPNPFWSG